MTAPLQLALDDRPAPDLEPGARALLQGLWGSAFPATLQDERFRLVDVNDAFVALTGRPRSQLIGLDPLALQPPEDQPANLAERAELERVLADGAVLPAQRRRLVDAGGVERWFVLSVHNVAPPSRPPLWLALLQDVTAEYAARDQARRAQDELAQWFDLAQSGMLVFDTTGLIVRSNASFEALLGRVPEVLAEAAPELQHLLGFVDGALVPELQPGAPPQERQALVPLADGRRRRLLARLACWAGEGGSRRVLAVVDDRSAEDERDLAQLEMGMLMDTASVGVATFDPARGWLAPSRPATALAAGATAGGGGGSGGAAETSSGAMLAIGRDLVEPGSLAEYERLQRALREGTRAEVRYAVRHPELGSRWLLTRVEPGALAGGRATTSVVTLDVTEQERAQRRNEQLLRELTTILDSSNAGIAYLRGPVLARCNRRFERMLGFAPGAAAGATLGEILSGQQVPAGTVGDAVQALEQGRTFETEFVLPADESGGGVRWVALSVRRADAAGAGDADAPLEAVAVLTDITRLKQQQSELERALRDRELMFNLSEVGIVVVRGARIERANQAMATLTGYGEPELTTLDPAELYVDARQCVEFEGRIEAALRATGRFAAERLLRRRDGSLRWVQVSVRPVQGPEYSDDADGAGGLICSFVDVDERHRAREALALQAERTRSMLNSVLVGIVTVGAQGIEWMNRSARRMFGGELADFVGEPIAIVATPEPEHPLRRADWVQRLAGQESETFECRLRGRDGREFWVVGNAVLSSPGAPAEAGPQLTFALLDIERRRQAEVSIAQAQASLQRLIETAPLAIALFDTRQRRVLQLNHGAGRFFGRPVEQVLGRTVDECFGGDAAVRLGLWLGEAAAADSALQREWRDERVHSSDSLLGTRVWDCRLAPLAAAGGAPEQVLLVASDVTEQRAAEQARLQAAIAQREVLVREVHHRIKNNLQGVAGLLRQNAARHPEVAGTLTEAVGQVQAIAQVYGLQVGATGPLAVAALLEAIAGSVERTFGRTIEVRAAAVSHVLPEAEAIPIALTVNELLTNAIKHGQGETAVRCAAAADGDAVTIAIASRSTLPAGFDLARLRGGVSGLGLVRALLPRRSATLEIAEEGEDVVARVTLRPPSVRREVAAAADGAESSP